MKNSPPFLLVLAGLTLLTAPILRADEPASPPADNSNRRSDRREGMHDRLQQALKELDLTADQKAKTEAIFKQSGEQRQVIFADTSLGDEQRRAKMRELRKSTMDQVQALLTPEQQTKLNELRAKHGRHGDQPPAEKPPGQ